MKIAFITESFPELSETFILGKVAELKKRGHEVTVFTQFKRRPDAHPDLLEYVDMNKVIRLPVWDRVRPKDFGRALKAAGPRPGAITRAWKGMSREGALFGSRALALVKSLPFSRDRFDLIHAHYAYMGFRYMEVSRLIRAPMVVSLLGHDITYAGVKYKEDYKGIFQGVAGFLASSAYLAGLAVEMGFPEDRITVHYPEVDTGFFGLADRSSSSDSTTRIISVCRLDWTKGLVYALEAVRILVDQGIDLSYRIVGDGKARDEVELAIGDLGLSVHVTLTGAMDRRGCRDEMAQADLFLMSSVTESFGLAAAEAQATGLPVVATNVGGLPEAVNDGQTGFLVASRNPEALAERMKYLIERPEERLDMGRRAREWAVEKFDREMLTGRLIKFYDEVIEEHKVR
jgi:colanic acid/amylovoran biosynthesis glycosyltransferase